MATSGNFLTSPSGQGGGNYYDRMIYEWWRTGWGRSGGVGYHNVSYQLKSYGGNTGYWINFWQGSMNTDGTGHTFASPTQVYSGGATVFGPYSKTMYTDSAGNRSFSASAQGGVYYNTINTSGSGSWSLDNIPMYGSIQSVTPNTGLTDETTSIVVDYLKYTGIATLWFRLDLINNTDTTYKITNPADPYTWSGFATWLRTSMVNTNSTTLYIWYGDDLDSSGTVDNYQAALTYPITIKNDTGQANPTFTDFTFQDTNATTSSITGNNQVLIQGKSTLEATVSTANKATANKNANMSSYTFTIGSYTSSSAWSNVSNVVKSIGTISDVTGTQNLSVTAVDSRTNTKTVTKSLTILPYASPAFVPSLTVKYTNSYDTSSGITVTASGNTIATISPLTLSGNDKNSVNGTSGVQFDVSKSNNTSYTGSWVNVATSRTSGSTDITSTLSTIASNILTKINGLTADNTVRWYIKFKIVDALETQYYETFIDIGKPIFRIGTDTKIYNNEIQVMPAIDEDAFTSNLDTRVPTQQSTKAYVDGRTSATLDLPYYNGDIQTETTGTTYKVLGPNRQIINGITKTNTTTLTVTVKGIYFIHIQQLISTSTNAGYFTIRINNADATYGYYTSNSMNDVPATILKELNVGDTIRVYQSHAITSCWAGAHSDITVYCIKRT